MSVGAGGSRHQRLELFGSRRSGALPPLGDAALGSQQARSPAWRRETLRQTARYVGFDRITRSTLTPGCVSGRPGSRGVKPNLRLPQGMRSLLDITTAAAGAVPRAASS